MADQLSFVKNRVLDSNANPGAGYIAYFFQSGTTSPIVVFTDTACTIPAGTSVTADANGKFAQVFHPGGLALKCVITDASAATVETIDPVPISSVSSSAASSISFSPTIALPFTNVQEAIEGAATSAASGFAAFGLGITGNNVLLANLDATNIGNGSYRFDATTTGTFPTGVAAADTGHIITNRETASSASMWLHHDTTDRVFVRRMASSAWGTWREAITADQGAAEGDILYRAAANWTRLAKGTAAQVLRMNAGATAPEWAASGTGWTTVETITLTGNSVETSNFVAGSDYRIRIRGASHNSSTPRSLAVAFYGETSAAYGSDISITGTFDGTTGAQYVYGTLNIEQPRTSQNLHIMEFQTGRATTASGSDAVFRIGAANAEFNDAIPVNYATAQAILKIRFRVNSGDNFDAGTLIVQRR
jgi:hypothetical protein